MLGVGSFRADLWGGVQRGFCQSGRASSLLDICTVDRVAYDTVEKAGDCSGDRLGKLKAGHKYQCQLGMDCVMGRWRST